MKAKLIYDRYYDRIAVTERTNDITSKELAEYQDKKEFRSALYSVLTFFTVLVVFAIWASNNIGSTY